MPTFFEKVKKDTKFRIKLFLSISLIFNLLYSIFLFIIYQVYVDKWFFVMAIYYGMLFMMRIFVFRRVNKEQKQCSKINTMQVCGCCLLIINLVVATMMFLLINTKQNVAQNDIVVIGLATFTFYSLTMAIYNSIKFLKRKDHLFTCIKYISLVSASVSLVTLTNVMLATFGAENIALRNVILPLLCGAVAIFIIVSAILMIKKANSDLRKIKYGEDE